MEVRRVRLRDYRNLPEATLELGDRFTVLFGHNGAGKTNVLEAVYLVGTLRSFRTSDTGSLVRRGQPGARVELEGQDLALDLPTQLSVRLERRGKSVRRTAEADGKVIRSAAQFYGRVRAIVFTPDDLNVLRGSPSSRRQALDRVVFARDRAHISDVQAYEKLVRSRNRVLRGEVVDSAGSPEPLLDTYEGGIAEVGARIWTRRADAVSELSPRFQGNFDRVHGGEAAATVRYAAKLEDIEPQDRETTLRDRLRARRGDDRIRGVTTVGPHRDDLAFTLFGEDAGEYASQGQARALMLAFKLAELQTARDATEDPPLLLLDDVSSELDPTRTAQLFEVLSTEVRQCILTTTAAHHIALPEGSERRYYRVDSGTLEPVENPV